MVSIRYNAEAWFARIFCALFVIVFAGLPSLSALADSYNVQAAVPYSTPTQAASFASETDGTTVNNAAITLHGSCQVANPELVVTIWRDDGAIGSTPCESGAFTLQIILREGLNTLIARSANASNLYGPDSQPVSVTLQLPPDPQPPAVTVAGNPPSTPAEMIAATNSGAASDLQVTPSQPFSVIDTANKAVTIQVVVTGGSTPYNIMLNWGDGTNESHAVNNPGIYSYNHTYMQTATYKVHGEVRDVTGAYTTFDYAVVSYKKAIPQANGSTSQAISPKNGNGGNYLVTEIAAIVLIGGLLIGNFGYRLGTRRAPTIDAVKSMKTKKPRRTTKISNSAKSTASYKRRKS